MPFNLLRLGIFLAALLLGGTSGAAEKAGDPAPGQAVPFRIKGDVISINVPGQGMLLGLADRNVAVHGLGPLWYWDLAGWERPIIGDTVFAEGFIIDFRGRPTHVAVKISWRDRAVLLRRPDNGRPVWHDQGLYKPLPPGKEIP